VADLAVRTKIIGTDNITWVDVRAWYELVDLDRSCRFQCDVLELFLGNFDIGVGIDLERLDDILAGHFFTGIGVDPRILDAVAGVSVDLIEADLLRIGGRRVVAGVRARRVTSFQPSDWQDPSVPVETVEDLTQPNNSGFEILRDDRVWDLRGLHAINTKNGARDVVGAAILTRVTQLIRRDTAATQYKYLFQTASDKFYARSPQADETVRLLRSNKKSQSGSNVNLISYELQLDVSRKELNREFQLQAQTKTVDAPWDRTNTWLGMRFTDPVPAATIRIIFPKYLPFKDPVFLKYPNDSGGVARSSDGIVLRGSEEKELLWRVDKPEPGMTYRIQWNWD
jgi:hypothetical protein